MPGLFTGNPQQHLEIQHASGIQRLTGLAVIALALWITTASLASAASLQQQRELYTQAKQQLKSGKFSSYRKTKLKLRNYALFPYLEYQEIRAVIAKPTRLLPPANNQRLIEFERNYPDFPLHRALRQNWLWGLAKQPDKSAFIIYYRDVRDRNLFCTYLTAKVASGKLDAAAKTLRRHWAKYGPPAKGCDEEVATMIKTDRLSNSWLVERLLQAMREGETKEVRYLQSRLPSGSAGRAATFLATDKDPRDRNRERAKVARSGKRQGDDSLYTRLTILHGIKKYARRDALDANALWQTLSRTYSFRRQDKDAIQDELAYRAARQQLPIANQWLAAVPPDRLTEAMHDSRLQLALRAANGADWDGLQQFANKLPAEAQTEPQWLYWRARAAEALGQQSRQKNSERQANAKQAQRLYSQLAELEHDEYYAFLAADRLNKPYALRARSTTANQNIKQQLVARPDVIRAKELFAIGKNADARREWWALQKRLNKDQQRQSAILAQQWGWHRQAIGVLSVLGERHDLMLRYPLPWQEIIGPQAEKNEIPSAWAFGILRAESMYQPDAKSGAGAYGLMQLMPATAKQTARRANVRLRGNRQLFQPATNIPLGTYYLGQMMNRFDGHAAVSTAAYNAGPNRVQQWLPKRSNVPVDIWVETIPYNETRRYVKKVMQYATVFDWRLRGQQTPRRMIELMPTVTPRGGNLTASQ